MGRGLSFVSAGGQEIPTLPCRSELRAQWGSARADTRPGGGVHDSNTHLHGDIQTDMEGSGGQVPDLWSLSGPIHRPEYLWPPFFFHFRDRDEGGQTLPRHHRTLDRDKPFNTCH